MEPRVSVVIPTYRRPEATVRAVRGALAQTIEEIEIIVVDDASGDGTADAVEAIGDPRVSVLRLDRNSGSGAARNRGIVSARAPFIALLDSDDELLPASLEQRLARLEARPESPFVYSRIFYRLSHRVQLVEPESLPESGDRFIDALVATQGLATSALMARREALVACLFDPSLAGVDDWDVALRLARIGPACYAEEPLTIIHAEDESEGQRITFNFDPEAEHRFIEMHRDQFDASPRAEAAVLYKLAMRAVRVGRRDLAAEYLERAAGLDPSHRKARVMRRLVRWGLTPLLPPLLRLRWKLMLLTGRVRSGSR